MHQIHCSKCHRVGTTEVQSDGVTINRGLDPNCPECRKALTEAGFTADEAFGGTPDAIQEELIGVYDHPGPYPNA